MQVIHEHDDEVDTDIVNDEMDELDDNGDLVELISLVPC